MRPEKRPFFPWKRHQEVRASRQDVRRWRRKYPDASYAVVTGTISGIVVLDFDGTEGETTREGLGLDPTVRTPSGGSHVYVRQPQFQVKTIARPNPTAFPGLDLRGEGGLAMFHGTSARGEYTFDTSAPVYELAELPAHLRAELVRQTRGPRLTWESQELPDDFMPTAGNDLVQEAVAEVRRGATRNQTGFALACRLRDERHTEEHALPLVLEYQRAVEDNGDHPYTGQEIYNTLRSAYSEPPRPPRSLGETHGRDFFAHTDLGNAERLQDRHGIDIRYCHERAQWLHWDSQRWAPDSSGALNRLAVETVRAIQASARQESVATTAEALRGWGRRSESSGRLAAMVRIAQNLDGIPIVTKALDQNPWLLNVENGTLDLRTARLRPHDRTDFVTRLAPVTWDRGARAPQWRAFLKRILPNPADRLYLQRAIGYALTGVVTEHAFFILFGTGANGKSLLLRVLHFLLGEYAQQAPADLLLMHRGGGATPEIARLVGVRFVSASETEDGARLAEAVIKQLTGGDRVIGRSLYENYVEFEPTHKLFLATNHRPEVRGTDEATWRRLHLLPFLVTIPREERDTELFDKLITEASGILRWAVAGTLQWQTEGLGTSPSVDAATAEYRAEQDVVGQFIDECCEVGPGLRVSSSELYQAYVAWAQDNSLDVMDQRALGHKLTARGFDRDRRGERRVHGRLGIALLQDDE